MRVALMRLYAETSGLQRVLQLLHTGRIQYTPQTPEADSLDAYLNDTLRFLGQTKHYGLPSAELMGVIGLYRNTFGADEIDQQEQRQEAQPGQLPGQRRT